MSDIDRIVGVVGVEDPGLVWGLAQFFSRWVRGQEALTASNPVRLAAQGGIQALDATIDALLAQVKEIVDPPPPINVVNHGSFTRNLPTAPTPRVRPDTPPAPMPPVWRGNSRYESPRDV